MQGLRLLWNKLRIRVISSVVNVFAHQTNADVKNTILVLGSTRSGTTFVMESLNRHNEYRIIFEPFNATYTSEWAEFNSRHYINPENPRIEEVEAVDKILSGKINNRWVDQFNRKIRSSKRIVKAVRANLLMDYIGATYPELFTLFIHRAPKDVVASRIKLNFDPKDVFAILSHDSFVQKYYPEIDVEDLRSKLDTDVKCHAALWCLENRFILNTKEERKIEVLQYESVIGKTIGLQNGKLKIADDLRGPSVTSTLQKTSALSNQQINDMNEILELFKMKNFV